jgi:hypothetical protein
MEMNDVLHKSIVDPEHFLGLLLLVVILNEVTVVVDPTRPYETR